MESIGRRIAIGCFVALFICHNQMAKAITSGINEQKENQDLYKNLQFEISKKNSLLVSLKAELSSLEKQLGQKLSESSERNKRMQVVEAQLNDLRVSLQIEQDNLLRLKRENEMLLGQYMMEVVNSDLPPEVLAKKKIVAQVLASKISLLTEHSELVKGKLLEQENLSKEFDEFKINKHNLDSLITELETQKKEVNFKYQGENDHLSELNSRLDSVAIELKQNQKIKNKGPVLKADLSALKSNSNQLVETFIPPLHQFYKYRHGNKGVTFHYQHETAIYSPDKGKVVYVGELASFGRVLMIEHENEIRSVILGNFETKLKKDDSVESEQVVGKTLITTEKENSLYYEIRKKNIVQNTIQWLDKKLFSSKI